MGTQCDNQGIDLLNTEASILFQSFVGFEGTANYWRSDDATRPQPGTIGFMTGEEQFIPTNLQPCSRYSYAISVTNCLGGPVATRFDANRNRTFVLPGARRVDNPDYEPAVFIDPSNPSIALGGDGCVNNRGGFGPNGYCTRSNVVNGTTATGATELLHPYTNQPFASELAALSWNLMSILVSTDAGNSTQPMPAIRTNAALSALGGVTELQPLWDWLGCAEMLSGLRATANTEDAPSSGTVAAK